MASTYLPAFEGHLPLWMLFTSIISVGNSIQAYKTVHFTARVYNPNPDNSRAPSNIPSNGSSTTPKPEKPPVGEIPSQVTPLSSRTFGTWTLLASIIRLYGAYYINNKAVYELAMCAYAVAWVHFVAEWRIYGTTRLGVPLGGPLVISTGTLIWMFLMKDFYLGQ
ncbi:ergosterol biosynthesis protein-like protein [Massarina eburnea CBS 473.64]|uniref:Ergosterol biosynthesis protein-like protein n=1 Tax=Massarina eburnea CBS 473.64 TaxID=1395130 RepID=A0A6A6RQS0_9PLEO|nr:ergosterol biosynthesis protein-like protein [Massarina eburnea CBS 473.64]